MLCSLNLTRFKMACGRGGPPFIVAGLDNWWPLLNSSITCGELSSDLFRVGVTLGVLWCDFSLRVEEVSKSGVSIARSICVGGVGLEDKSWPVGNSVTDG